MWSVSLAYILYLFETEPAKTPLVPWSNDIIIKSISFTASHRATSSHMEVVTKNVWAKAIFRLDKVTFIEFTTVKHLSQMG